MVGQTITANQVNAAYGNFSGNSDFGIYVSVAQTSVNNSTFNLYAGNANDGYWPNASQLVNTYGTPGQLVVWDQGANGLILASGLNDFSSSQGGTNGTVLVKNSNVTITGSQGLAVNHDTVLYGNVYASSSTGNLYLGPMNPGLSLKAAGTATNYARIIVRPNHDITANGQINNLDALAYLKFYGGTAPAGTNSINNLPFVLNHYDNTYTGIMIIPKELLTEGVNGSATNGMVSIVGSSNTGTVMASVNVGALASNLYGTSVYGGFLSVQSATSATSTLTGALQVLGGVGIQGNVYMGNILNLQLSAAAPTGVSAGTFAVADRVNWDPASKGSGNPYPVFYDGAAWNALY